MTQTERSRLRRLLSAYAQAAATLTSVVSSFGPLLTRRVTPLSSLISYGTLTASRLRSSVVVVVMGAPLVKRSRTRRPRADGDGQEPSPQVEEKTTAAQPELSGGVYLPDADVVPSSDLSPNQQAARGALPTMAVARQTAFERTLGIRSALGDIVQGRSVGVRDGVPVVQGTTFQSGPGELGVETGRATDQASSFAGVQDTIGTTTIGQGGPSAGALAGDLTQPIASPAPHSGTQVQSSSTESQTSFSRTETPVSSAPTQSQTEPGLSANIGTTGSPASAASSQSSFNLRSSSLTVGGTFRSEATSTTFSLNSAALHAWGAQPQDATSSVSQRTQVTSSASTSQSSPLPIGGGTFPTPSTASPQTAENSSGVTLSMPSAGTSDLPGTSFTSAAATPQSSSSPTSTGYAVPVPSILGAELRVSSIGADLSSTIGTLLSGGSGAVLQSPSVEASPSLRTDLAQASEAVAPLNGAISVSAAVASLGLWKIGETGETAALIGAASSDTGYQTRYAASEVSTPVGYPARVLGETVEPSASSASSKESVSAEASPRLDQLSTQPTEAEASGLEAQVGETVVEAERSSEPLPTPQLLGAHWRSLVAAAVSQANDLYGYLSSERVQPASTRPSASGSPSTRPSSRTLDREISQLTNLVGRELIRGTGLSSSRGADDIEEPQTTASGGAVASPSDISLSMSSAEASLLAEGADKGRASPPSHWTSGAFGYAVSLGSTLAQHASVDIPSVQRDAHATTNVAAMIAHDLSSAYAIPVGTLSALTAFSAGPADTTSTASASPMSSPEAERLEVISPAEDSGASPGFDATEELAPPFSSQASISSPSKPSALAPTIGTSEVNVSRPALVGALAAAIYASVAAASAASVTIYAPSQGSSSGVSPAGGSELEKLEGLSGPTTIGTSFSLAPASSSRSRLDKTAPTFFGLAALASVIPAVALLPYSSYKGQPVVALKKVRQATPSKSTPSGANPSRGGVVQQKESPPRSLRSSEEREAEDEIDEERLITRALEESADALEAAGGPTDDEDAMLELRRKIEKIIEEELRRSGFQV